MRALLVIGAAVAALAVAAAQADDVATTRLMGCTAADGTVPAGEYRQLGFWSKTKLALDVYTNPQVVRAATFAYGFDPKAFAQPEVSAKLFDLAKDGKIGFGTSVGDAKAVAVKFVKMDDPADLSKLLGQSGIQVISAKDSLLGTKAGVSLIAVNTGCYKTTSK
jgi:hypothetical protein